MTAWDNLKSAAGVSPPKSSWERLKEAAQPPAADRQEGRSRPTAVSASKQTKKQSAAPVTAKAEGTVVFASSGPTSTTQNTKTVDAWQMLTTSQLEQMEAENEARKKNAAKTGTPSSGLCRKNIRKWSPRGRL